MIYIASDHGGFALKSAIIEYLTNQGVEIEDIGPHELNPVDDYPDYAIPLANKVRESSENRGIVLCRNGVGMCITVNKIPDIRCALSWNTAHAISSRRDDNTNVLALPADYITQEEAENTTIKWLNTEFSNDIRHLRRLKKVKDLEK